jgi:hypothetical protein
MRQKPSEHPGSAWCHESHLLVGSCSWLKYSLNVFSWPLFEFPALCAQLAEQISDGPTTGVSQVGPSEGRRVFPHRLSGYTGRAASGSRVGIHRRSQWSSRAVLCGGRHDCDPKATLRALGAER